MRTSDLHSLGVVPLSFRCIGIRLQPMTLGHLETLERLGITDPANIQELVSAVFVCAIPWRRFQPVVASRWLPLILWVWRKTVPRWDIDENLLAFRDYLATELTGPPVSPPHGSQSSGRQSTVPLSRYLMAFLCSRLNHDPRYVRDYRVRDALWDHAAIAEMDGRGVVEELPYDERVAEMEALLPSDDDMAEVLKGAQ